MSAFVYCLYSTRDGVPRYVGKTDQKVSYRFNQHVVAALEKEKGPLYDWFRDEWRAGFDILIFTLQRNIIPKDLAMFEQYWIDQFADLLNIVGNRQEKKNSGVADQVIVALKAQLNLTRE